MTINDILIKHEKLLKKYNNLNIDQLNNVLSNFISKIKKKVAKSKKYKIEKIIKKKITKDGVKYFVKWEGFNNRYNSWINNDNFYLINI